VGSGSASCGAAAPNRASLGAVERLARRQHGVITRAQLVSLGLEPRAIDRRVRAGKLRRLHRGVYLLGVVVPPLARELAAVLACGPGAFLSHRSAAGLWQLLPHPAPSHSLSVTVSARDPGTKPGIVIHRVRMLPADETTTRHRIPVTTPARTLLDLATDASTRDLEQAVAEAHAKNRARRNRLLSLVDRHPRHRGAARLRALLHADHHPALTRSKAERRLLELIRAARLPHPDVNARVGDYVVDLLWRGARVVVEVDGLAYHSSARAFERDHRREVDLAAEGFQVIRVSRHQIVNEAEASLVRIAQALALRASPAA
jgi:very-short-patch-repair endonuclease